MASSEDSRRPAGKSKRTSSTERSLSLASPMKVDVYIYHDGMVRLYPGIQLSLISENIAFPIDPMTTGWLRVETIVAGCLGASNAIHCLISGGTTLEDVLQVFGEPETMWKERTVEK